jgi:hypothetical protein
VGTPVIVEADSKPSEITLVLLLHLGDQLLFRAALLASANHDCRAVGIVSADVDAAISTEPLESGPNVSLDVLHQMAQVNWPISVRECGGDQNATLSHNVAEGVCGTSKNLAIRRNAAVAA